MTAANAVTLAVVASIFLIVLGLGARSSWDEAMFLFRRPMLLLRAMTAMYILAPAIAVTFALLFNLSAPVSFALVALAISPIPPILPKKQFKVGADSGYAIGLLVAATVIALVATPLLLSLAADALGVEASISIGTVAKTVLITIGAPLTLGILLNLWVPETAERIGSYATVVGTALLLIGLILILFAEWRAIWALVGNGAVVAIAAMVIVSLLIGHIFGAGSNGNNAALALATATRHPGVAISVATVNFADQKLLAVDAVLLFLIVNAIVSLPYVSWSKRQVKAAAAPQS